MKNLWKSAEAARFQGDLGQRVYSSRLLGSNPCLVLHGGGNTSVKIRERNIFGDLEEVLHVKGSGWDLGSIEARGFSPCRMGHLLRLSTLDSLADLRMAEELKSSLTRPSAPSPSVEAILHALIPARYVDHTHADAFVAVSNTEDGEARVRSIYGDRVLVVPYVMPGFKLARVFAKLTGDGLRGGMIGVALMNHGLISFGDTAEESYGRMIELVSLAEVFLRERGAGGPAPAASAPLAAPIRSALAGFRRQLCGALGGPAILAVHPDPACRAFASRQDVGAISQRGPATPDHVIRTKRVPMVGRDLAAYKAAYEAYYQACVRDLEPRPAMLDPAPRVILDPEWGMVTVGTTARDAAVAGDLYRHTIDIIRTSEGLGGWKALPAQDIFDCEYWDLEQAKLRLPGARPAFAGEIALVTGAASGIGRACVEAFIASGAAVVGLDLNPAVAGMLPGEGYLGIACDVTREADVADALERAVRAFGGLDMLVLNAGIFPPGMPIGDLGSDTWRRVMAVNLDATFSLMRECHPLLKAAPKGGRVVVIGSKNVPAPGPGAAAYSASKAAVNQLARVAALEWGPDGIRINSLHPNMVFDTALWTQEILEQRARHYGITVEAYKTNNVLRVEVTSRDVAALAADLCGPHFAKTTGAQVPVDGGNDRVI